MAMVVNHNLPATNAYRHLGINNSKMSKSIEKLSSGLAINRAGDDAAGLAVSEKMRAQISGLNQAVKNAQDGISMIQTFEGALTETDSILQRMRTLAAQSANGTYQDDVDREAIQLEFDQLNDELNQIADTDFNGVVVLNGGQMADGLVETNGKFDYAHASRNAKQLSESDINKVDDQQFNDLSTTDGRTKADTVWASLFDGVNRTDTLSSNDGPSSADITFKYDATATDAAKIWTAVDGTNGAKIDDITVTGTANGGFTASIGGVEFANVVLDQPSLQNGDTITLTLNNPKAPIAAPTNAGAQVKEVTNFTQGTDTNAVKADNANITVKVATTLTDAKMTSDVNKVLDKLNGAQVEVTYNSAAATAAGDITIGGVAVPAANGGASITVDGQAMWAAYDNGKITLSTVSGTAKGEDVLTIDVTKQTSTTNGSAGKVTYTLAIDNNTYDDSQKPSVTVKKPDGESVSKSDSFGNSTSTLTYTDNITLQVGARTKDSVNFTFAYESNGLGELKADLDCSARGLGTDKLSLLNQKDANKAIDKIDNAINKVSMVRGSFGAMQNRLEHKVDNLNVASENLTAAESAIRDTDMAKEMMNFTKSQILSQASQAMLAQANQLPQGVLQLLQ